MRYGLRIALAAAALAATTTLTLPQAAEAGLATKFHRLVLVEGEGIEVPKGPISWKVENHADDERAADTVARIESLMDDSLRRLDFNVSDDAEYTIVVTVEQFSWGSRAKRAVLGPLSRKAGDSAYIGGQVKVMKGSKVVDVYDWSHIPRGGIIGGSPTALGKQAGPPLLLKWSNGERDSELHIQKGTS